MDRLNLYRKKQLPSGEFLLTVDSGDWLVLSEKKLRLLEKRRYKDDTSLYRLLRERFMILDKDNSEEYVSRLRESYSHLFTPPSLHIVAVTARCNLACSYCHANAKISSDSSLDMDLNTAKRTVDFIFSLKNKSAMIEFQGGEPLLNFETVRFITEYATKKNKAAKKDLRLSLVTNLTLMDKEKLEFCKKNRIGLCTSLDGPAMIHDRHRKNPSGEGTHAIVADRVERIRKEHPIEALMVATKDSLPYPKEIVDEYDRLGFKTIQLRPFLSLGQAIGKKGLGFTADEYLDFWKIAMERILEINKRRYFEERYSTYMLKKLFGMRSNFVDLCSPCGAIVSTLAYDHEGKIYSCDEGRQHEMFCIGDVDKRFEDMLETEKAQCIIRGSVNDCLLCDACAWKPFCGVCQVCNYAEDGNLVPKLAQDTRCKILDGMFTFLIGKIQEDEKAFARWVEDGQY